MYGTLEILLARCDCPVHVGLVLVVVKANVMGLVVAETVLNTFPNEQRARRYAESEQGKHDAFEWVQNPNGPVAEAVSMLREAGFGGVPLRDFESFD